MPLEPVLERDLDDFQRSFCQHLHGTPPPETVVMRDAVKWSTP